MPGAVIPNIPVTGPFSDELQRYSVLAAIGGTGSTTTSPSDWVRELLLIVGTGAAFAAQNPIVRVTVRADPDTVTFSTLRNCVDSLAYAWQRRSSVPPLLKCAELLGSQSALSMTGGDWGYELEATPTEVPRELETESARSTAEVGGRRSTDESGSAPPHSRLAADLRDMTGLSTATLGSAFGVSREQYSRWISGRPISDSRHGQLQFLHTVVRELLRRLGTTNARVWLHQPIDGTRRPIDLLTTRQFDRFYREVVALPIRSDEPHAGEPFLPLLAPLEDSGDDDSSAMESEPWSPYSVGGATT
jgi:hypothetical protein